MIITKGKHLKDIEEAERRGYLKGKENTDKYYWGIIENEVFDMYSFKNWQVNPQLVFSVNLKGVCYLKDKPLTFDKSLQLKQDANQIINMLLWDVLQNTLRQKAIEKSVIESENWEQVLSGKMMIHSLNIINTIVEQCKKIDIDKLPKNS